MSKLYETFLDGLSDIYDAEKQLLKALPKMSQAAENESLKAGFEKIIWLKPKPMSPTSKKSSRLSAKKQRAKNAKP